MTKQLLATFLSLALVSGGCASASGPVTATAAPPAAMDRNVMAEYAQRIAVGSKVRVERTGGPALRGTLLKASPGAITVQRNTRVPEAPIEVPIDTITRLTLDQPTSSVGRNIAIGVASGVGATFGVLFLLAAIWSD